MTNAGQGIMTQAQTATRITGLDLAGLGDSAFNALNGLELVTTMLNVGLHFGQ